MVCTVVALGLRVSHAGAATPLRCRLKRNMSGLAFVPRAPGMTRKGVPQEARRAVLVRASDEEKSEEVEYNKEFGYSRKDVLLIGAGLIGGGFFFKWALEVGGVDPIMAGTGVVLSVVSLAFRVASSSPGSHLRIPSSVLQVTTRN